MKENFFGEIIITEEESKLLKYAQDNQSLIDILKDNEELANSIKDLSKEEIDKYIYQLLRLDGIFKEDNYDKIVETIKKMKELSVKTDNYEYFEKVLTTLIEMLASDSLHTFVNSSKIEQLQEMFKYIKEESIDYDLKELTNKRKEVEDKLEELKLQTEQEEKKKLDLEEETSRFDSLINEKKDRLAELQEQEKELKKNISEEKEIIENNYSNIKESEQRKIDNELKEYKSKETANINDEILKLKEEKNNLLNAIVVLTKKYELLFEKNKIIIAKNNSCTYEFVNIYNNLDALKGFERGFDFISAMEKTHSEKTGLTLEEARQELKRNCGRLYVLCRFADYHLEFWDYKRDKKGKAIDSQIEEVDLYGAIDKKIRTSSNENFFGMLDNTLIPYYYEFDKEKSDYTLYDSKLLELQKEIIKEKAQNETLKEMLANNIQLQEQANNNSKKLTLDNL